MEIILQNCRVSFYAPEKYFTLQRSNHSLLYEEFDVDGHQLSLPIQLSKFLFMNYFLNDRLENRYICTFRIISQNRKSWEDSLLKPWKDPYRSNILRVRDRYVQEVSINSIKENTPPIIEHNRVMKKKLVTIQDRIKQINKKLNDQISDNQQQLKIAFALIVITIIISKLVF